LTFVRNLLGHYGNTGGLNLKQHGGRPKTKVEQNFDFFMRAEN